MSNEPKSNEPKLYRRLVTSGCIQCSRTKKYIRKGGFAYLTQKEIGELSHLISTPKKKTTKKKIDDKEDENNKENDNKNDD